jgi:hypothetical protein
MKLGMKYWRSSLPVVIVVMALMGSTMAFASNPNPGVFPPNSHPFGLTYAERSVLWWKYASSVTSFEDCTLKQSGKVLFLGGTFDGTIATRNCTVPAGKAIMFPTFNAEWSILEAQAQQTATPGQSCLLPGQPFGTSDAALQACATALANLAFAPGAELEATVDGRMLQSLRNYRALSQPFDFTAVDNNVALIPAGPNRGVADGFWIILTPLSAGKHTVDFMSAIPFMGTTLHSGANYCLIVLPSNQTCP